jgi:elongation factor 3
LRALKGELFQNTPSATTRQRRASKMGEQIDELQVLDSLKQVVLTHDMAVDDASLEFAASICHDLIKSQNTNLGEWQDGVGSLLSEFGSEDKATAICSELIAIFAATMAQGKGDEEGAGEGERPIVIDPLVLSFMGYVLIEKSRMELQRGHCYGLVGRNGAGE